MIKNTKALFIYLLAILAVALSSCETEDPGPLQEVEKEFSIIDFDRVEMGDALHIEIEQGSTFSIETEGDRRNINDLEVYKSGSTLIIKFKDERTRQHDTYIDITMPVLKSVNFSGASVSKIKDFESDGELDVYLSGASTLQLVAGYRAVNLVLSGASNLLMRGLGDELHAEVSGASVLSAFEFPVGTATLEFTGASVGKVTVSDELKVMGSGASSILYRGNPTVTANTTGDSSVQKD